MTRYLTWGLLGVLGIGAFVMALDFGFGGGPSIGSAHIPLVLSGGLILVALWGLLSGPDPDASPLTLRPLAAVAGGVLMFILTIDRLGLIPATLLTMFAAYLGQTETRYAGFLVYALLFAGIVWLLFTIGLGLPVNAFGGR